ncbi:helix-hairpin-helix domain-containing protein [Microcoleus sp. LEGE 07076]|uniref:phospholipase D-like domain-containing protein n=1 Tax=Microcoleus sp. LEGE 07076 TaxID=915322 RepID=UPI00187EA7F3|nr:helix-hairpin-helix domain-containing protein [Microcoleus sp. LEGE 07076]
MAVFYNNLQVLCCAGLLAIALAGCGQAKQDLQKLPQSLPPLPQDPLLQVYFNQSLTSSYTEPYRQQTRPGDDLEKLVAEAVASARSTVDVAVQEFRLPGIARSMVDRHRSGIKVRLIVEHLYARPWSDYTAQELGKLPERERDRYSEFVQLVDTNKDGKLSAEEIKQNDALIIVKDAGIPVIDDTADGSKGSGLMHHKFLVIDSKTVIVTSANFTTSDIHGDFKTAVSRGNANNLLKIESLQLGQIFNQEFNIMWGDGPGGKPDSKFGLKKQFRAVQKVKIGNATVAVQFSPTSATLPWEKSVNSLIEKTLGSAKKSVNLALFVFSAQRLSNTLEIEARRGVAVRALIDSNFIYRFYSEGLDMMGATLMQDCSLEADNRPWRKPLTSVGVPMLPKGDRLHHKFGVIDEETVITGSHNWSEAANRGNDETLLAIESPTVAAHFEREFDRLYKGAILGIPARIKQKIDAKKKECESVQAASKPAKAKPQIPGKKLVNLNAATQQELETLPGVDPKLAERIIAARQQQPFTSLEDVARVQGIGDKILEKWRDRVTW